MGKRSGTRSPRSGRRETRRARVVRCFRSPTCAVWNRRPRCHARSSRYRPYLPKTQRPRLPEKPSSVQPLPIAHPVLGCPSETVLFKMKRNAKRLNTLSGAVPFFISLSLPTRRKRTSFRAYDRSPMSYSNDLPTPVLDERTLAFISCSTHEHSSIAFSLTHSSTLDQ